MTRQIKLRNCDQCVLMDDAVYEWLTTDPHLVRLKVVDYLFLHDTPRVIYRNQIRIAKNQYVRYYFYLHKIIADQYMKRSEAQAKWVIGAVNGNLLDCRLENLFYQPIASALRKKKINCTSGYKGVYAASNRYKAVINVGNNRYHIGCFATARLAAIAFNEAATRYFGKDCRLNIIPDEDPEAFKLQSTKYLRRKTVEACVMEI